MRTSLIAGLILSAGLPATVAQGQTFYNGTNATGQLVLTRTVNAMQTAQTLPQLGAVRAFSLRSLARTVAVPEKVPQILSRQLHPPLSPSPLRALGAVRSLAVQLQPGLAVVKAPGISGFNGLTHFDQRQASNGNQFSVEPPNPSIAVANGFILEGVNNAVQVYDMSGKSLLPRVLASNELFGVSPAINRATDDNGVYPTDMRVFFDQGINRWFVLQRSQDNDFAGNMINRSHIYLAVSQSPDPTGTYNIYVADTTNASHPGCPCLADYPQIGADQYGFYISANEFNTSFDVTLEQFVDATIFAISKAGLAAGATNPTAYKFTIPFGSGFEFAIQPATTPPGASYFLASGGVEYFASTEGRTLEGSNVALWAMSGTSGLATGQSSPLLTQVLVPTFSYIWPNFATQPDGPRPYGATLGPVPVIDGGDTRALSLSYAGARLYLTFGTAVTDEHGKNLAGGAYITLSPTLRSGVLKAQVLHQSYLSVTNNHLLRPSVAVNADGRGSIAATVVGPDWYPSAAFVPVDTFSTPSTVQIAAAGKLPEDGFTGYPDGGGLARWGDYSTAVAGTGGSVWSVVEYITDLPRTDLANWDTFIMQTQ